jgi:hypothetical protein
MVVMVVLLATAAEAALPASVVLERVLPRKGVQLADLKELDRARHVKMGVVNLSVESTASPFARGWVALCTYHNTYALLFVSNRNLENLQAILYQGGIREPLEDVHFPN